MLEEEGPIQPIHVPTLDVEGVPMAEEEIVNPGSGDGDMVHVPRPVANENLDVGFAEASEGVVALMLQHRAVLPVDVG
ncbi:hypothetical protein AMTR_s00100p00121050 [Amborella trichopoda]|uniref:Uncharacterized protein n=1 Tax=Amborella trichopoda TaxID=13333 RepID=W1P0H4_AMBTC|nr:hypothetical protein AMTR_s00100p00121050 [Amborella trichopoda]